MASRSPRSSGGGGSAAAEGGTSHDPTGLFGIRPGWKSSSKRIRPGLWLPEPSVPDGGVPPQTTAWRRGDSVPAPVTGARAGSTVCHGVDHVIRTLVPAFGGVRSKRPPSGNRRSGRWRPTAVTRYRTTIAALVVLAIVPVVGCGESTEAGDLRAGTSALASGATRADPDAPSTDDLRQFREAAAAAPYWATVDWSPPTDTEEAARNAVGVIVGTVGSSHVTEPLADDLRPYEGAPTLYSLVVAMSVEVDRVVAGRLAEQVVHSRIPVVSGGMDWIDHARPEADRIVATTPIGATGVFLVRPSSTVAPVAFESATGELVAFFESMDGAVETLTTTSLADTLRDAISS